MVAMVTMVTNQSQWRRDIATDCIYINTEMVITGHSYDNTQPAAVFPPIFQDFEKTTTTMKMTYE